jgi:hypothetical protein
MVPAPKRDHVDPQAFRLRSEGNGELGGRRDYSSCSVWEVGRFDSAVIMIPSNRELRGVLQLKGYQVMNNEFDGGHDYVWWRGSLADGLISLLGQSR